MKMEATVTKRAVPSIFTVAPMGRTNFEIRSSTKKVFRIIFFLSKVGDFEHVYSL